MYSAALPTITCLPVNSRALHRNLAGSVAVPRVQASTLQRVNDCDHRHAAMQHWEGQSLR
jgi:hypothetical protein